MEAIAKLRNYPTSPRKMRLLADLIRGQKIEKVLAELEHSPKHPAVPLRKLVLSAINNWKQKNQADDVSELSGQNNFCGWSQDVEKNEARTTGTRIPGS